MVTDNLTNTQAEQVALTDTRDLPRDYIYSGFPARDGKVVCEGHVTYCANHGHVTPNRTWCYRCGENI